ncbi:MAG TPA: cysteine--tRNA ligase [Ignavibacteriaceae bacterium]|jgi:cysteinyl-tRNA synthetase|nr:cysteine--tRNA ligase [Ignavibacteriaceae bacterium]
MKVYNTLTKQKEEFQPIKADEVKMYVCGPTVYDYFHIGNARSFIVSDLIRRYLQYKGYKVTFAMNLTDVDDKIIKKANESGNTPSEVAEKYIKAFFEDIENLKVRKADIYPKATGHIVEIIKFIQTLETNGFAYNKDGNVFYNVKKFQGYGKLSGKKIDELEIGARIEINDTKENPLDFALWKKAKEGEPYWESPWGKGRPGWHIECSAMSCKHLGESFDIHAGGNDLIFPHHENEIAQSEAATGKQFVKYWLHFGFLNINEEKMSKSLGNFLTAREILKKYPAEAIRFFFFQTHYAGPLNFSFEMIEAAQKGLEKIQNLVDNVNQKLKVTSTDKTKFDFDFSRYYTAFEEAMDDDFNSPRAIAVIFDFVKDVNKTINEAPDLGIDFYQKVKEYLEKTADEVFGIISFEEKTSSSNLEHELIELLIKIRLNAKKEKNFQLSDSIRNELKSLGVILQDTKDSTSYKKE